MRLLYYSDGYQFSEHDVNPPPYAILSHTWSENNDDEVLYHDILHGAAKDLTKLDFCRDQAAAAGLEYFWIDTCCIDKRNEAELAYAIRSMHRWYKEAALCLVYLSDLSVKKRKTAESSTASWQSSLKDCRWFKRGWTLQELIASRNIEFFARDGYLGSKEAFLPMLFSITGIDLRAPMPNHRTRLGWVANRVTKRPEDKAYCMMGVCEVVFSPRYGEGEIEARRRLEAAILQRHGSVAMESLDRISSTGDHRQSLLDLLRFDAMDSRRMTIAVPTRTTCRWILEHPMCTEWLTSKRSFFWIKGKPGAGKSVMVKFLDEYIRENIKSKVRLSFYFTARGEQLEKTFAGMYRSLLVQLLDAEPEVRDVLDEIKYSQALDIGKLQSALAVAVRKLDKPVYVFIDAVDECQDKDVQDMIDFFENLQDETDDLFVCFASRLYPIYEIPTRLELVLNEAVEHTADLERYVRTTLRLARATPKRREEVTAGIIRKASGVFLWVVLVVKILQKEISGGRWHAVQDRLEELPPGLTALFQEILRRDQENMDEFILSLRWILYAERPQRLPEFYFAMMAGLPTQGLEWILEDITEGQMHAFLTTSSKGFAECTTGKKPRVQFIHESVRDFLVRDNGMNLICGDVAPSAESVAHEQLKNCCIRGLAFDCPEPNLDVSKSRAPSEEQRRWLATRFPFAEYATTNVLYHANRATPGFPQHDFISSFERACWIKSFNAFQKHKIRIYDETPSFSYICAERNLDRLIIRPCNALQPEKQRYRTPLIAAMMTSSWNVARVLLDDMGVDKIGQIIAEVMHPTFTLHSSLSLLDAPWRWAVRNGLEYLAKFLLRSVPATELPNVDPRLHALLMAVEGDSVAIVNHLLSMQPNLVHGVSLSDARSLAGKAQTPLILAAILGRNNIVEALYDAGVDVNVQVDSYFGNALQAASLKGHKDVVETLLDKGADVNRRDKYGINALQEASQTGHNQVVELLLAKGADVNSSYALGAASQHGHKRVVETLLAKGADPNVQAGPYGYPLQAASRSGKEEVVEILLAYGADANAQGGAALQDASLYGHEKVVEILLAKGADFNAQAVPYSSALQAASQRGHEKLVQVLLNAGASWNDISYG